MKKKNMLLLTAIIGVVLFETGLAMATLTGLSCSKEVVLSDSQLLELTSQQLHELDEESIRKNTIRAYNLACDKSYEEAVAYKNAHQARYEREEDLLLICWDKNYNPIYDDLSITAPPGQDRDGIWNSCVSQQRGFQFNHAHL